MINFICKYCKNSFEFEKGASAGAHVRHCKFNPNKITSDLKNRASLLKTIDERKKKEIFLYNKQKKKCFRCEKILEFKDKHRKFCSASCSAKYNNQFKKGQRRKFSEQALINIKEAGRKRVGTTISRKKKYNFCKVCGVPSGLRIFCSKKCLSLSHSLRMKEKFKKFPELHPNKLCSNKLSYPENMLKLFFIEKGLIENLNFISQFKVNKYFVDFYLPKLNLCIEVDGKHWHQDIKRELIRENIIKQKHKMLRFDSKKLVKKEYEKDILDIIRLAI